MFGEAFDKCIGCSKNIVKNYMDSRFEFVLRACNEPDFLEELTGITAMMADIKLDDVECFDFDEEMN
jgi:ubiquitin-like modifier-activating enzyme ATG7